MFDKQNQEYIAKSRASREALKSANLLRSININAVIVGERGVGKKKLAKYVMDSPIVDGTKVEEILNNIENRDRLIIKNFDKVKSFDKLDKALSKNKTRIIATSEHDLDSRIEDRFFSLKICIPPLSEREEDVKELTKKFYEEAREIFGNQSKYLDVENIDIDISENCYSLKRSIYKAYLLNMLNEKDILHILEKYLYDKIGTGNDYRELLYIFDVPLIKSGFKKFNSQLAMSREFGLNRNTLRKKIAEYEDIL